MFKRDHERYEGVRPVQIYLLRLLYGLMFLFVGFDAWSYILLHEGSWDPLKAAAWSMFASYSLLSILGVFRPLRMLPLVLFMVLYKSIWLVAVAYPLWSANQLAGSPAEGMAKVFIYALAVIAFIPWRYAVESYVLGRRM